MAEDSTNNVSYSDDAELLSHFLTWTSDAVIEMREIVEALPSEAARGDRPTSRFYDLTHNIKGMGSSFDFDLMTAIGVSMCGYFKGIPDGGPVNKRILESHVRAFEVVLENRIKGNGGEQGIALRHRLDAIIIEETSPPVD